MFPEHGRGELCSPAGDRRSPLRIHIYISAEDLFSLPIGVIMELTKAFLREEGGTRSVTEGACVTLSLDESHCNALSLSQLC